MEITLLYFDDCPHWRLADERLAAVTAGRTDVRLTRRRVCTPEEAKRLAFHGSPSIQVNGVDLFPDPTAPAALTCRLYRTPEGTKGAPTVEQLRLALDLARARTR